MKRSIRALAVLAIAALTLTACAGAQQAPPSTEAPGPAEPAAPVAAPPAPTSAERVTLVRSPSCGCCSGHAEHLQQAGFEVDSVLTDSYGTVKESHAIPGEMRSCHTSLVGRYFVEGHVPAAAIEQLLREQPDIDGIALPGMPPGSPGMEGIAAEPLTVFAIEGGDVIGEFGRFAGAGE